MVRCTEIWCAAKHTKEEDCKLTGRIVPAASESTTHSGRTTGVGFLHRIKGKTTVIGRMQDGECAQVRRNCYLSR